MIQMEMVSERGDCDITILQGPDDVRSVLGDMFPDDEIVNMSASIAKVAKCSAVCKQEGVFVAFGAINWEGDIKILPRNRAIAEAPVMKNFRETLQWLSEGEQK